MFYGEDSVKMIPKTISEKKIFLKKIIISERTIFQFDGKYWLISDVMCLSITKWNQKLLSTFLIFAGFGTDEAVQ